MLSLHTNAASLSTQNSLSVNNKNLTSSMSKLGTGLRVNSAMDDAAGLQIATRLNAQSRGMQVAQKNTQNGISMLQTAEGAMNELNNMLLRMKDLATESANGTSNADDKAAMQAEFDALGAEISNILKNTSFAGSPLFSDAANNKSIGTAGALKAAGVLGEATKGIKFQVGATADETIDFKPGATNGSLNKLMNALKDVSTRIGAPTGATSYALGTAPTPLTSDDLDTQTALLNSNPKTVADIEAETDKAKIYASLSAAAGITIDNTSSDNEVQFAIQKFNENAAAAGKQGQVTADIELLNKSWSATDADLVMTYGNEQGFTAAQTAAKESITAYNAQFKNFAVTVPATNAGTELTGNANAMITTLNTAINAVGTFRSDLGAVANRLDHTFNNLSNMITNTETAKGRIMDVDYATETSNMTKNQMLMQASSAMLKQSNSMSQMVASLLQ